ncbi:hypothetical protein DEU56DRAFT_137806 [Suillus clintonianus]|uniref:uncharacterized protein n=1 Tax=Suillus clintonianus TaxID=1904413 RepID=UPI001B85F3CF|nr:uncharacterized protein DEU56DRAFT_137806 [Suillus clintonianus]KAG2119212.1 hypothetical protein DEU56DRAFT_137806 [Suillus clintonianus]
MQVCNRSASHPVCLALQLTSTLHILPLSLSLRPHSTSFTTASRRTILSDLFGPPRNICGFENSRMQQVFAHRHCYCYYIAAMYFKRLQGITIYYIVKTTMLVRRATKWTAPNPKPTAITFQIHRHTPSTLCGICDICACYSNDYLNLRVAST